MIDVEKQVAYWKAGAEEDWAVALDLLKRRRTRHCLFFVHLAIEKALKAHVCRKIQDIAPRTHDLLGLARTAELNLSQEQAGLLSDVNAFNIQGRYPEMLPMTPKAAEARAIIPRAEEILQWLMNQL